MVGGREKRVISNHRIHLSTAIRSAAVVACLSPTILAFAQQSTETYSYDALGRLVKVGVSGGQNAGETHSICYDKAGNRTEYRSTSDGSASTCAGGAAPTPTPTPAPTPTSSSLAVGDSSGIEGNVLGFVVTLSPAQSSTVTVSYATAYGSAASTDFYATAGTLTFSAGQTSKIVAVSTKDNAIFEGTETFMLNLSGPTGPASITDGQGIGTIYDNDDDSGGGQPMCGGVPC